MNAFWRLYETVEETFFNSLSKKLSSFFLLFLLNLAFLATYFYYIGDIEQLALDTWMNLNEDNKVSLYVSYISFADGSSDTIIINKHDQEEEA